MARHARIRPTRLAKKLRQIRVALDLSQSELLKHLGLDKVMDYRRISEFELGTTEPPLWVLLQYARAAGVPLEGIVDDELDLPENLLRHVGQGIKRNDASEKTRQ